MSDKQPKRETVKEGLRRSSSSERRRLSTKSLASAVAAGSITTATFGFLAAPAAASSPFHIYKYGCRHAYGYVLGRRITEGQTLTGAGYMFTGALASGKCSGGTTVGGFACTSQFMNSPNPPPTSEISLTLHQPYGACTHTAGGFISSRTGRYSTFSTAQPIAWLAGGNKQPHSLFGYSSNNF